MDKNIKQHLDRVEQEIITIYQKMTHDISPDNKASSPWILLGSSYMLVAHCPSYASQKDQLNQAYGYLARTKHELAPLGLKPEDFDALEDSIRQTIMALNNAMPLDSEEEKKPSFTP